jgi:hypothetical protein
MELIVEGTVIGTFVKRRNPGRFCMACVVVKLRLLAIFMDVPLVTLVTIEFAVTKFPERTLLVMLTGPTNPAVLKVLSAATAIRFPRCPRILLIVVTSPPT